MRYVGLLIGVSFMAWGIVTLSFRLFAGHW